MLYLKRSTHPERLVGHVTFARFHFTDIQEYPDWWLMVRGDDAGLCVNDPGKDVGVHITSSVKTLANIRMGESSYRKAVTEGTLKLPGPAALTHHVGEWMQGSLFAGIAQASEIGGLAEGGGS